MLNEVVAKASEFWARVRQGSEADCWPWQAGFDADGYGSFQFRDLSGKKAIRRAHRVAFMLHHNRELSDDVVLRHSCDSRACCNPRHTLEGSHNDNVQDRVTKGRSAIGTQNGRAELTEMEVTVIRNRLASGESMSSIAKAFHVDRKTVPAIRDRRTWKHLP